MTIVSNVGIVVYTHTPKNFDKLLNVALEIERVLIEKYGKEAVNKTRISESKEYNNYSMAIFVNVPEQRIQLTREEAGKDAKIYM